MKLSQLYFIFLFVIPLFWSCKPKCPVYSCNIRMHHRHGLIMKPKTLEEWGKEVNQKMNGSDSTQVDDETIDQNSDLEVSSESISDSTSTVEEPKLTKEEKKAKKKQEKEEKKRKKKEEKAAKKKEKEEAKAAKEQEKEDKRIAEGKPPKKKKPKKEKDTEDSAILEEEDPDFSIEETPEDKEQKEKEEAAQVVYRSRTMRWWKTKDKKPKVGHRWKKPKNKEKNKRSKAHNKKAK